MKISKLLSILLVLALMLCLLPSAALADPEQVSPGGAVGCRADRA